MSQQLWNTVHKMSKCFSVKLKTKDGRQAVTQEDITQEDKEKSYIIGRFYPYKILKIL